METFGQSCGALTLPFFSCMEGRCGKGGVMWVVGEGGEVVSRCETDGLLQFAERELLYGGVSRARFRACSSVGAGFFDAVILLLAREKKKREKTKGITAAARFTYTYLQRHHPYFLHKGMSRRGALGRYRYKKSL